MLTFEGQYALVAPYFITVIILDMVLSAWLTRRQYTLPDTATNIYLALTNFGLDFLMKGVCYLVLGWFFTLRLTHFTNPWAYWILLFVLQDFCYYLHHYVDHHSRLFWAVHVTHHSSEQFNLTTGFRSPVLQPLYRYWFFVPLALLGFEPLHIMFMYAINQNYGTLVHTQHIRKLGVLEWVMVTPSHHRVHHASNVPYLDKNLGMVLIIWDRLFGTFQSEDASREPVRYGLTKNLEDRGPVNVIFHEWRAILQDLHRPLPLRTKLRYLLGPPGWSHDGSRQTSKQLQAAGASAEKVSAYGQVVHS